MKTHGRLLLILLVCTAAPLMAEDAVTTARRATPRTPNRLIHEQSPYLLQHAYNPVDWYPWGPEAFAKAAAEDKPVFLSIGYSTCHWCHVMERESFENPDVAALINRTVVAIKVDREERPDIDAVYMQAVMAMAGQGGWPLNVFLTPEGRPFWGGTYFPPEDRDGRPGLARILQSIAEAWKTKRAQLLQSGQSLTEALQQTVPREQVSVLLTPQTLTLGARQFAQQFDERHGGFGGAPKFPRSHALSFLLRVWARTRDPQTLAMVERTLDQTARGGIHDHLGGGFHRYATDDHWLTPHFEKMLYDQALLARTYLEAYQATGHAAYAGVARDILDYVLRDLTDAAGGFYSAEDADSEGEEGKFYVWTPAEVEQVLGVEEARVFNRCYDVTAGGNFEGRNILHLAQPMTELASALQTSPEALAGRLADDRAKLLAARNRRVRPHRDDKVLADWNGLMLGALAYGGRVLDEPRYTQAAERAAAFLLERMERNGQLLHRYRNGEAAIPGYLDDYAFVSWGLLDLYEDTGHPRWLEASLRLTREMVRLFWDEQAGGFFLSGSQNETLIARTKELYDGAVPSGNSVAALCLARLSQLTADESLRQHADRFFQTFAGQLGQQPHAFPQSAIALDWWLGPRREVVIAGPASSPQTQALLAVVRRRFLPRTAIVLHPDGEAGRAIESLAPFIKEQTAAGRPTAYVCENYVCQLPTTDPARMAALLEGEATGQAAP